MPSPTTASWPAVSPVKDMLLLPGIELDCETGPPRKYWHFVGLGIERAPSRELKNTGAILDYLKSEAAFRMASHPYWSNLSGEEVAALAHCHAVEVHNTVCQNIYRGRSEQVWDYCLSTGMRLFGVAVDDTHQGPGDLGVGWVMVKAPELTVPAILSALQAGQFYASTGPRDPGLRRLRKNLLRRHLSLPLHHLRVQLVVRTAFHAPGGTEIVQARYQLQSPETYLRVQCTDAAGRRAWSNPIHLA